jgi:hypothetical protein
MAHQIGRTSYGIAPEDSIVTFRLFRAALLASPRFASLITPPPPAIAERTAQGGRLMSATEETFGCTIHLAVARDILKALAPFEALPWPPDAPIT